MRNKKRILLINIISVTEEYIIKLIWETGFFSKFSDNYQNI